MRVSRFHEEQIVRLPLVLVTVVLTSMCAPQPPSVPTAQRSSASDLVACAREVAQSLGFLVKLDMSWSLGFVALKLGPATESDQVVDRVGVAAAQARDSSPPRLRIVTDTYTTSRRFNLPKSIEVTTAEHEIRKVCLAATP